MRLRQLATAITITATTNSQKTFPFHVGLSATGSSELVIASNPFVGGSVNDSRQCTKHITAIGAANAAKRTTEKISIFFMATSSWEWLTDYRNRPRSSVTGITF
jgi:hypothetical protein